jgi:hypothetical protein
MAAKDGISQKLEDPKPQLGIVNASTGDGNAGSIQQNLEDHKPDEIHGESATEPAKDVFADIDNLRVSIDATVGITQLVTHIPVRKPKKTEFFRVNPQATYQIETQIVEEPETQEFFLVAPSMHGQLTGEGKIVRLVLAVTAQGAPFLWPLTLPDPNGRRNAWADTALQAAAHARQDWIRLKPEGGQGCYLLYRAQGPLGNPAWPDKPFNEILRIAFQGRIIDSPEHPVVRRLRGLTV